MALPSTLYKFRIELSDVDRNIYEALEFRVAQHPSEAAAYLLTRVLAYALSFGEGLEFSAQGLSDSEAPALRKLSATGELELWIEIGNPSARKLHKASKAANKVKVYTYKDPNALVRELTSQHVHGLAEIEIYSLQPSFLQAIERHLSRDNRWGVVYMEGVITVNIAETSEQCELVRHRLG